MLKIVHLNTKKETELSERVGRKMKLQIQRKFFGSNGRNNDIKKVASHSFTKSKSIEQIQNQTV